MVEFEAFKLWLKSADEMVWIRALYWRRNRYQRSDSHYDIETQFYEKS